MNLPDINPLAAKLMGGRAFREQLREQLLQQARATDDEAYRRRLIEVADGKRPLRTLAHDPRFPLAQASENSLNEAMCASDVPQGSPAELMQEVRERLHRSGTEIPSIEEARALYPDAQRIQQETQRVLNEESLTGWGGSVEAMAKERDSGGDRNQ